MATPEGFRAGFTGKWAASRYRSFNATRAALAQAGIRTVQVAMGPRGGKRWFLDPVPLTAIEIDLWRRDMQSAVVNHHGRVISVADFPGLTLLALEAVAQAMNGRPWQWVDLDALVPAAVDALTPEQSRH